jgi:hypothetical protein
MRTRLSACGLLLTALLLGGPSHAQQPKPPGMTLAEAAARRFPQPVRVGDLIGRRVLQPLESQPTLGWVLDVVQQQDGTINVIVNYGGVLGFFARPIAVPVDAMALLGQYMEILDFTPEQLSQFKTFDASGVSRLPPDGTIRVGLARPSH